MKNLDSQSFIYLILILSLFIIYSCEKNEGSYISNQQSLVINEGMDSLNINPEGTYLLSAVTYLGQNTPSYTWQTTDSDIISISLDPDDNAIVTITAKGSEDQTASITVIDNANILSQTIVVTIKESPYGQFFDIRNRKNYETILIGNQVWMAKNLYYPTETGGWQYPDLSTNSIYGMLYDWETAQNVCPSGWHLPSDDEWTELENYLIANGYNHDGSTSENKIGKSLASTSGWVENQIIGNVGNDQQSNNSSGFNALPGGYRHTPGYFNNIGLAAYFWSSTNINDTNARSRVLVSNNEILLSSYQSKTFGLNVRCVKD